MCVFPPDDWFLDTYMYSILIYDLLFKVWLMGCANCFIFIDWWGKGWPLLACPFLALVTLYQMLPIFTYYQMFIVWATVSTIVQLPRLFPPTELLNNGLDLFPWTSFTSCPHTILKIFSRSGSGLATDSPCDVWGRGWTTCLLCDGPILCLCS